jgi:hypothetical protein
VNPHESTSHIIKPPLFIPSTLIPAKFPVLSALSVNPVLTADHLPHRHGGTEHQHETEGLRHEHPRLQEIPQLDTTWEPRKANGANRGK